MLIYKISTGEICANIKPDTLALEHAENYGEDYAAISEENYSGEPYYRNGNFVDYTSEEIATLTEEYNLSTLREQRNNLLAQSDWTQSPDSPLSDSKKTEWATYRQALRDLPSSNVDLENPIFPTKPE